MQTLLSEARVDSARPSALDVWEVFKRFALEQVVCADNYLLFQVGDSETNHDTYFDFCREFKQYAAEGAPWFEQLHIEFSAQRPHQLGFAPLTRWSYDFGSLGEFFVAVEGLPEFRAAASFQHWSFRVYHTRV